MAVIQPQPAPIDGGVVVTLTAAAPGGDKAAIGGGRLLFVRNGHTAEQTVTLVTPGEHRGLAIADVVKAIPAGGIWVQPLSGEFRAADGRADLTYSGVTALTVAVVDPEDG